MCVPSAAHPRRRDNSRNGVPRAPAPAFQCSRVGTKTAVVAGLYGALQPRPERRIVLADAPDGVFDAALDRAACPVDRRLRPPDAPAGSARSCELSREGLHLV